MDRLWQRLSEIYGSGFTSQYGDVGGDGYETWLDGLIDIQPEQIKRGLQAAVKSGSSFPPNLAKFRDYCLSFESFGLPTREDAYQEACCAQDVLNYPWSHPAVYHAGHDVGWFDLRIGNRKMDFVHAYHVRCQQAISGCLPPVPKHEMLESPQGRKLTPAERQERMKQLREAVGI